MSVAVKIHALFFSLDIFSSGFIVKFFDEAYSCKISSKKEYYVLIRWMSPLTINGFLFMQIIWLTFCHIPMINENVYYHISSPIYMQNTLSMCSLQTRQKIRNTSSFSLFLSFYFAFSLFYNSYQVINMYRKNIISSLEQSKDSITLFMLNLALRTIYCFEVLHLYFVIIYD